MWAVVPLKGFASAKQRLAGVLNDGERQRLAQAMIADVLAVLSAHPDISGVVLVADEPAAEWLARYHDVTLLREAELGVRGLNPILTAALDRLAQRGVDEAIVMHGDVPLLSAADIDTLLRAHRRRAADGAVGVTDREGVGTNALVLRLPLAWPLAFGADSWRQHQRNAEAAGIRLTAVDAPGLQHDVDLPADLLEVEQAQDAETAANTRRLLAGFSAGAGTPPGSRK